MSLATDLKKAKFVEGLMMGMSERESARHANIKSNNRRMMIQDDPWVKETLQKVTDHTIDKARTSRAAVEEIVLEAVDIARMKAEPGDMIRGASELNKMNGYYAAEKKEISIDADIAIQQMQEMSDAELLQLMDKQQDPIEAEFERIDESSVDAEMASFERIDESSVDAEMASFERIDEADDADV